MDAPRTVDNVPRIPSEHSIILDLPPSCVQFSPSHPQCFVVGTYYLDPEPDARIPTSVQDKDNQVSKPTQDRSGSLMLFKLNNKGL